MIGLSAGHGGGRATYRVTALCLGRAGVWGKRSSQMGNLMGVKMDTEDFQKVFQCAGLGNLFLATSSYRASVTIKFFKDSIHLG